MGLDVNSQMDEVMKYIEEVSKNILEDQVSLNIHSKAGAFRYIRLKDYFQNRVITMEKHGGVNLRDENEGERFRAVSPG